MHAPPGFDRLLNLGNQDLGAIQILKWIASKIAKAILCGYPPQRGHLIFVICEI